MVSKLLIFYIFSRCQRAQFIAEWYVMDLEKADEDLDREIEIIIKKFVSGARIQKWRVVSTHRKDTRVFSQNKHEDFIDVYLICTGHVHEAILKIRYVSDYS